MKQLDPDQAKQNFETMSDDDRTAIAQAMFVRAGDDLLKLGCPLNCTIAGQLRAVIHQATHKAHDVLPLVEWMRQIADELEREQGRLTA